MNGGIVWGVTGGVIGVLGGVVGTYFSIKNTNGPRERAFMVRCGVIGWIALTGFLVLLFLLPVPYKYLLWIPYAIVLPLAIRYVNKRQAQIREAERK